MTAFKRFVSQQVELAQSQLHELLLINQEETREDVMPKMCLRSLQDDPTISTPGWNFIKDPRNTTLHNHERWLLNRIANSDWLQQEFLDATRPRSAHWSKKAAKHYLQQVDAFL